MKFKLILLLLLSFSTSLLSAEELGYLSPEQLKTMQNTKNALVIDIRTEKEWKSTGIIPDSQKLQFFSSSGKYDADKWLNDLGQLKKSPDQPVILVCGSGGRSGKVGNMLAKKLGLKNIYHLSNGIMPWIKSGHEITK